MAPTIGVNLRVTGHCNQGGRKYMEDMFSVAYQQTADELDLEYAYFGIFDGHGGQEAAMFAKEHLMKAIVSQSGFWSDNDEDVLRAIKDGFIATHYAMWRNLENWPRTQSGLPSTSGTTASIAFIRRSNIYVGHVGDSCIVLGYQDPSGSDTWKGAALTEDHKPESPMEHKRIYQAGGQVVCKAGVPRVVWHRPRLLHQGPLTRSTHIDQIPFLAVARSLGDLWSYNADSDRFVVSPEPDVFVHHIDLTRDKCLIFGTDGLWNMLSPSEAVSIVAKAETNNKSSVSDGQDQTWQNPSKCLVDIAIGKWVESKLRADNTSAVTLLLDPLGPPTGQLLDQQYASAACNTETNATSHTDFVPYHIESYKVNEGKSTGKSASQSNGLAICTWYPHKLAEEMDRGTGMTTLSTMEELFGQKVDLYDLKPGTSGDDQGSTERKQEEEPSTSSAGLVDVPEMLREISLEESLEERLKECAQSSEPDENVDRMKLRGKSDSTPKNYQKTILQPKPTKRSGKKGKRRKTYEVIKCVESGARGARGVVKKKRRHSSMMENPTCEPRVKRRTRSEDQRGRPQDDDYKSDAENKLEEMKRLSKARLKTPEPADSTEPMRLRSNVPMKTLRSRNINLDHVEWSQRRAVTPKTSESTESSSKNIPTKSSVHVVRHVRPQLSAVHTRSHNRKYKK